MSGRARGLCAALRTLRETVLSFDPRLTPARPDLAARHLQGKVEAARFIDGEIFEVIDAVTAVRREPRPDAAQETQALRGERVTVYETTEEGWCWGQLAADGYVGWLSANAVARPGADANYKVTALSTLVFPAANIKVPPIDWLPLGARLSIARIEGSFAIMATGGFIPAQHVAPLETYDTDLVAVAERFLGTPYLWGGKSSRGIDCSGLVQVAASACGIICPRDSDMQEASFGEPLNLADALAAPRRGDAIFWRGHVALVRDSETIIHANAHHMAVAIEPIDDAIARIQAAGSEVMAMRRVVA